MSGRSDLRDGLTWAALGTILCGCLVLVDLNRTGTNPLNLIQPGVRGPSIDAIQEDFPDTVALDGVGLDGQQFYAMARDPLHVDASADDLDRPRYRWQRPLLPWLAGLLHPANGTGLIWALFAVSLAGVFVGSVATARLSTVLGGPAWAGVLFGIVPGSYYSLRVTVADALGLALAMAALALSATGHRRTAVLAGIGAVLAKEVTILVLVGWWLHRRCRARFALVVVPAAAAAAWFLVLRRLIPGEEAGVGELAAPFTGWGSAILDRWVRGDELWGMVASLSAVVAGGAALVHRRFAHPLAPAVAIHLAFTIVCNGNVLGQDFGGTRSTMALLLLGMLTIATPGTLPQGTRTEAPLAQGATGMAGPGSDVGGSSNR